MQYLIAHVSVDFGENYDSHLSSVISVSYDDSVDGIGARCTITCPLNAKIERNGELLSPQPVRTIFNAGDKIRVQAWYEDYDKRTVFEGYIYQIKEGTPAEIVCEDEVYLLRSGRLNKSWKSAVTLKEVLTYICSSRNVEVSDDVADLTFDLGYIIDDKTPLYELQRIKNDTLLLLTFRKKKLVATAISTTRGDTVKLNSGVNVIGCSIQQPNDVWKEFSVTVKFTDPKTKKVKSFTVGDPDGHVRVAHLENMNEESAKEFVNTNLLDNLRTGMYEGTLETLLYPIVNTFDLVDYYDRSFQSLNGTYTVKRVNLRIDSNGCRQTLTVAQLVNDNAGQ